MPRGTCLVGPELRSKLYALTRSRNLYILADDPFGEGLHVMTVISDRIQPKDHGSHLDVILDARGLRFKRELDV